MFYTIKADLFTETMPMTMAPILTQKVIRSSTLLKQTKGKLPT